MIEGGTNADIQSRQRTGNGRRALSEDVLDGRAEHRVERGAKVNCASDVDICHLYISARLHIGKCSSQAEWGKKNTSMNIAS